MPAMTTSPPASLPKNGSSTKATFARAVTAASIGNALEWFDWGSYAAFAAIFSVEIFAGDNGDAALLSAFAVFGVGFLARPLGGLLIGRYADWRGRRPALTLSIALMALGSLLIGLTPTYQLAGVWAAVMLTVARLIQGLAVGGDYGAAPILLSEIAPPSRRGLVSSLHYVSLTLGLLTASVLGWALSSTLTAEQLASWGWRLPFLVGALAALWGFYLRRSVEESEVFVSARNQSAERRAATAPASRTAPAVLRVIGMTGLGSIVFWTMTSYLPSQAHNMGIPHAQVFGATTFALLIFMMLQPVVGWLSDRVGRKPLLIGYSVGFVALSYPLVAGIRLTSGLTLFLVMLLGLAVFSGYSAISAAFLAEQFPTRSRSTGAGIAHNVSSALFGGTAPYLLARLTDSGHTAWFAAYMIIAALISGALFSRISEARGKALPE